MIKYIIYSFIFEPNYFAKSCFPQISNQKSVAQPTHHVEFLVFLNRATLLVRNSWCAPHVSAAVVSCSGLTCKV